MSLEIPNYTIEKELGKGGMATVYLARQNLLSRSVALKVMSTEFASSLNFQNAFLNEGRIVAQLEHPNIIKIYDIGSLQNTIFFMAMEYLSGGSLRDRLTQQSFTPAAVLAVLKEVGAGLHYAHEQGFLHRDIKPENILFRKNGSAVLTDFGIAKLQDSTSDMTRMGLTAGTVYYMSPEQATTSKLTERSDLYSLGLVAFEMLSGERVCKADSLVSAIYQHTSLPVPTLPASLAYLQNIMDKVLAKQTENRYASVNDFVQAFEQQLERHQHPITEELPVSRYQERATTSQASATGSEMDSDETILFQLDTNSAQPHDLALNEQPKAQAFSSIIEPEANEKPKVLWRQPLFLMSVVGGLILGLIIYGVLVFKPYESDLSSKLPNQIVSPSSTSALPSVVKPDAMSGDQIYSSQENSVIKTAEPQQPSTNPMKRRSEPSLVNKEFTTKIKLNLRAEPNASSRILSELAANTVVKVINPWVYDQPIREMTGSWVFVSVLNQQGYVYNGYLEPTTSTNTSNTQPPKLDNSKPADASLAHAKPAETNSDAAYVVKRSAAKLYEKPEASTAGVDLALNSVVFLQSKAKAGSLKGENGQWLYVKTPQGKSGYLFDLDVFPLVRVSPSKDKAEVFKFEPYTDVGVMRFNPKERRKVYSLIADKGQKLSLNPKQPDLSQQVRLYIFGDKDLSILANNVTAVNQVTLPSRQRYFVNFHWDSEQSNLPEELEYELSIKY